MNALVERENIELFLWPSQKLETWLISKAYLFNLLVLIKKKKHMIPPFFQHLKHVVKIIQQLKGIQPFAHLDELIITS